MFIEWPTGLTDKICGPWILQRYCDTSNIFLSNIFFQVLLALVQSNTRFNDFCKSRVGLRKFNDFTRNGGEPNGIHKFSPERERGMRKPGLTVH